MLPGARSPRGRRRRGPQSGKVNYGCRGSMVYWEPSHEPWCSARSPGGGLRVSGSSCGRRGASPGFIYAPQGTIFSTLVGSPGARLGFSGTMDLRKFDWRFKRQLGFHFFELPLACHGDLRFTNPLPARGAESVVAYLLFDDPACRLVVSGCSGFRPRAGSSGCRDLQNLIGP